MGQLFLQIWKSNFVSFPKPGFHYMANATTTTPEQRDYKVKQSTFTPIALLPGGGQSTVKNTGGLA